MSIHHKIFPEDYRNKTYQLIAQSQKKLLPVVLFFHQQKTWKSFKQYLVVAISPQFTIHQLIHMLQVKLTWKGYLTEQNKSLFVNVGQNQITSSLDKKVKTVYDQYKKSDGWLQLQVTTLSSFG